LGRFSRDYRRSEVARDDIVDALVVAATAAVPDASLRTVPFIPEHDSKRLPMEMVYSTIDVRSARHNGCLVLAAGLAD